MKDYINIDTSICQYTNTDLISKAINEMECKIDRFLRDELGIKKVNFLTKLKLSIQQVEIRRQRIEPFIERVSIFKNGKLKASAEFKLNLIIE